MIRRLFQTEDKNAAAARQRQGSGKGVFVERLKLFNDAAIILR